LIGKYEAKIMKKIAVIIDSLAGGGAERVMLTLAQEMLAQGHTVTFFSLKENVDHIVPDGIDVVFPFKGNKGSLRSWFNGHKYAAILSAAIKTVEGQQPFDLVLVNLLESYRLTHLMNLKNCFYVIHNSFNKELQREKLMGPIKYWYMRKIIKHMSGKRLIAVSDGVAQELTTASLYNPSSVTTIYNPFDIDRIKSLSNETTEQLPFEKYILHVGRAAKAKRHDVLFAALKLLEPPIKLVCLTGNTKKLRKLSEKMGVSERVILPGFTTNPYPWIKNAELLALSSDFEGLPTVLIEAIVCGTKIVSTNCPHGPNEILLDELSQYLVPPQDPRQLATAINNALTTNINLSDAKILGKINVKDVSKLYLALC
jgi:glycosyltransferase involved in cell wall biosynthesis